jgi:hypothetical protein
MDLLAAFGRLKHQAVAKPRGCHKLGTRIWDKACASQYDSSIVHVSPPIGHIVGLVADPTTRPAQPRKAACEVVEYDLASKVRQRMEAFKYKSCCC